MLFCDLAINGVTIWSGVPCLNGVNISTGAHLGFVGGLVFMDTMGSNDPVYTGLDSRFVLIYIPGGGAANVSVPLQAVPAQQLNIILGNQNCVLSFYDKDESLALIAGDYLALTAPLTCSILSTGVASAVGGSGWIWNVVNGTIISGQGTSSIVFQPTSGGSVIITVTASLVTGGVAQATATVLAYNPGAFSISAPEYVWAGQFGVNVSAIGGDAPLSWTAVGAVKMVGNTTQASATVDIGMAGVGSSVALAVGGVAVSSWTFKVIPYTSPATWTTAVLAPGAYEDFILPLGWQYRILTIQTDNPGCLRIYETASARIADSARAVTVDPSIVAPSPATIVVEVTTKIGYLTFNLPFQAVGTNGDTPRNKNAYCRIYNTGASMTSITVVITRTELQASGTF